MENHKIVSRNEWLVQRKQLLAQEKEFTRLRDQLSQQRRELPWVKVDKPYLFDGPNGQESLSQLFDNRSQLVVYHFMFDPSWEEGCPSCSFWADNFNSVIVHLNQRDVSMVAISRAPLSKLEAFKARMGWSFTWVSAFNTSFNQDFNVSFPPEEKGQHEMMYNFAHNSELSGELPGISVFTQDRAGSIFHTYSCYARGLDMLNTAYHYLDLVPKGRDEANLEWPMAWLRYHDRYEPSANRIELVL